MNNNKHVKSESRDYYVYCYIDPRNFEEFYYGKGRGNRSHAHLSGDGDSEKATRIKQIKASEIDPTIRVIATDLTEGEALLIESTLIWKLGKRLTNKVSGHFASRFRPQNTMHKRLVRFDFSNRIHFFNVGEYKDYRSWEDCRTFGFLSAGFGLKYKAQANKLRVGDLVAAYVSGHGYVGVGLIENEAVPAREFRVGQKSLKSLKLKAPNIMHDSADLEKCEYVVRVKWLKSKKREDAVWKKDLFRARQTRTLLDSQPKTIRHLEQEWNIHFEKVLSESRCATR